MHVEHELVTQPIPALLRKLAVPAGTGFFFNTMFNVVDTFYGGMVSTAALAALSLSFPVFFLIIATGSGISTGTTTLVAHAIGRGDQEEARHLARQALSFGLLNGALITLVGILCARPLFRLLGANDVTLPLALSYINAIFAGSVFFIVNYVLNAILTATGDSRSFRNFLVAGFFLNLAFDPWFLFGGVGLPPLGLPGIAWATVAVQALGNVYLLLKVVGTGMLKGYRWRESIPLRRTYVELVQQGFPSSLNMGTVALGIFVITWFVGRFGSEAVAAYGIATRIEQMALLPVLGMNVATLAVVAQNNGARKFDRVSQAIVTALKAGVGLMVFGTATLYLLAHPLMALFTRDAEVRAIGVSYLQVACFVCIAYVILYISVAALQGLKRPLFPLAIGVARQVVLPLPVFYLFAHVFGWGLYGIWWGILLVTWGAACCALLFVRRTLLLLTGGLP